MFCSALAPYDDKHIYDIREQKIKINWCTRADISDSLATLFIFRDFETALLVQSNPIHLCVQCLDSRPTNSKAILAQDLYLKVCLKDSLYGESNLPLLVYKVAEQLDLSQLFWRLNMFYVDNNKT